MGSIELSTARLRLRRLTASDRPALLSMLDDYEVVKNLSRWPHPVQPDMVDDLIARHKAESPGGYGIVYGDELAGLIGAGPRIGYFLGRDYWGLGVMTEALTAVQKHALRTYEALSADTFVDNPASAYILEKCGWRETGVGESYSEARGEMVTDRRFVKCNRYDWLESVETERLVLRPCGAEDFEAVWEMVSDEKTVRMLLSWPWPPDVAYIKARLSNAISRAGLASAIVAGNETIGLIGATGGEIWYFLSEGRRGRGFATEALRAKVAQAFSGRNVTRLTAGTWHDNPVSMRVLENAGFERVGWGSAFCRGRNSEVEGPEYELTRAQWEALH